MNERIKQLARQAEFSENDLHTQGDNFQYFAELIVRECAGIYDKIDNGNLHMGTDNYLEALHRTFRS